MDVITYELKTKGFYNFLKINKLRNKDLVQITGYDKGNVSKYINHKLSPPDNFITTLEKHFSVRLEDYLSNSELLSVPVQPENIEKVPSNRKTFDPIIDIQTIPVYDSTATLGIVEIFNGSEKGNVLSYLSIPNLPKSDGAIFMTGDSMYPLLKSGDIVALKIISPLDIIYGEMYYVEYFGEDESTEFKVIKYVKKSLAGLNHIQLVSYNQHHEPKDILISRIRTIAIVNASVRYNRL
ncbi:S24 family peptidase [Chryseobacterium daeguense]|uniref:S24 family peptidase n=1 Tax=Chryseobacterium daeguense TaxID=412438 RepID=UPI00040EC8A5|nr:S24 family peptidase [Chryseobacterium daeguense]